MARLSGVDTILNVVQNATGRVIRAFSGDLEAAHQAGADFYSQNCLIELDHKYDVVVVTCGGYPRDQTLYQAQKAMALAESAAAQGAVIVLVAKCPLGMDRFADNLKRAASPWEVMRRYAKEGFNNQQLSKAYIFARAVHRHIVIVSCDGIEESDLKAVFCRGAASPQEAMEQALAIKGEDARVLVAPYAVDCLVHLKGEKLGELEKIAFSSALFKDL